MPGVKVFVKGLNKVVEFPSGMTADEMQRAISKTVAGAGVLGAGALGSEDAEASFLGQAAKTAAKDMLGMAQKMENAGLGPDEIWQKTGWGRGADSKWRFEVDDSQFSMNPGAVREEEIGGSVIRTAGGDIFNHPALQQAYPDMMKNMNVIAAPNLDARGEYSSISEFAAIGSPQTHYISLKDSFMKPEGAGERIDKIKEIRDRYRRMSDEEYAKEAGIDIADVPAERATDEEWYADAIQKIKEPAFFREGTESTALHELQHAAQNIEGFAKGGNAADEGQQAYERLAGEVEARNTQKRIAMTPEERRATPPWLTEDVPRENQIVRYGGAGAAVGLAGLNTDEASAQTANPLMPSNNMLLSIDQLNKLPSHMRPDVGSIRGPIKGDSDVVSAIHDLGGLLSKFEVPVLGNPVQGLADYMQNFGYNDSEKERLKRAAMAVLDFL